MLRHPNLRTDRPGYALIAVLIVVVVLSLAAYRFADAMTAEYQVAVRSSEAAQAKAFAASGVHYAAGALSDPDTLNNQLGGSPYDNQQFFGNQALGDPSDPKSGRFSLMAAGDTFNGTGEGRYVVRYGPTDESAKLNLNALIQLDATGEVLFAALMKLPNMTEDVADAIVDWLDADENPRTAGAESSYYQGLPQPYRAKNGPINSLDELLLVRGVTPQLLYGNDRNRNGRLDPGEEDGNDFNRGWSEFLTVYGRELNVDTNGNPRINLNDNSTDAGTQLQNLTAALGQYMADYVMAARLYGTSSTTSSNNQQGGGNQGGGNNNQSGNNQGGGNQGGNNNQGGGGSNQQSGGTRTGTTQTGGNKSNTDGSNSNQQGGSNATVVGGPDQLHAAVQQSISSGSKLSNKVNSVLSLVNTRVTLPKQQQQQGQGGQQGGQQQQQQPTVVVPSPLNDATQLKQLLPQLMDLTTTQSGFEITPRVNVNNAPPEVLAALPGLQQQDVDAIVAARTAGTFDPTDPATTTGAWLVTQASVSASTFQSLEKYVTGRTMTYRVHSVGYFGKSGPVARVEAVIDTNQGHPRILYYRELTDLGRGFDLPR